MSTSNPSRPVSIIIPQTIEDGDFTSLESPVTLNLNVLLGKNASGGQFDNIGQGRIGIQISSDGVTFGDTETVTSGRSLRFEGTPVHSIKATLSDPTQRSGYRVIGFDQGQGLSVTGGFPINNAIAEAPSFSEGDKQTVVSILPQSTNGRRGVSLFNNGRETVWLAFGGFTPVVGSGVKILRGGNVFLDSGLVDDDEIDAISTGDVNVSFQVWGN